MAWLKPGHLFVKVLAGLGFVERKLLGLKAGNAIHIRAMLSLEQLCEIEVNGLRGFVMTAYLVGN